ncbi:MAG: hypothetical protein LBO03_04100 [Acidaminococcales bacterium]|nr:hypothetical protein [Acidaminococcales bacterium]
MKRKERATAEAYKPPGFVRWFNSEQLLDCHFLVESYLRTAAIAAVRAVETMLNGFLVCRRTHVLSLSGGRKSAE